MTNIGAFTLNDLLAVEPYQQGQGLQGEVKNGFAFVKQKNTLAGLKLILEARLNDGSYIPAGSTIYIKEEFLMEHPWAKQIRKSNPTGNQEFILVELKNVVMIDTNEKA